MVLLIIWVSFPFISVGSWLLGDESTLTGLGVLGFGAISLQLYALHTCLPSPLTPHLL